MCKAMPVTRYVTDLLRARPSPRPDSVNSRELLHSCFLGLPLAPQRPGARVPTLRAQQPQRSLPKSCVSPHQVSRKGRELWYSTRNSLPRELRPHRARLPFCPTKPIVSSAIFFPSFFRVPFRISSIREGIQLGVMSRAAAHWLVAGGTVALIFTTIGLMVTLSSKVCPVPTR